MRKILFSIMIVALLIFTGIIIYKGTDNGSIWGVTQISNQNDQIDKVNAELEELVSAKYTQALSKLNSSSDTMQETKQEYEEQAILVSQSKYYKQTDKYRMDFLWTKIGNYAKDNNVQLKLEIANGTVSGLYNLKFTVTGKYADIAGLIYDIENDSRLGFKIEDFQMTAVAVATTSEELATTTVSSIEGKFTCKDISIDVKSLDSYTTTKNVTSTSSGAKNVTPTKARSATPTVAPTNAGETTSGVSRTPTNSQTNSTSAGTTTKETTTPEVNSANSELPETEEKTNTESTENTENLEQSSE